jgi:hypothetical protein
MLHKITFVLMSRAKGTVEHMQRTFDERRVHHPQAGEFVETAEWGSVKVSEVRWIVDQDRLLVYCYPESEEEV